MVAKVIPMTSKKVEPYSEEISEIAINIRPCLFNRGVSGSYACGRPANICLVGKLYGGVGGM